MQQFKLMAALAAVFVAGQAQAAASSPAGGTR